jgi:hypothetical protein
VAIVQQTDTYLRPIPVSIVLKPDVSFIGLKAIFSWIGTMSGTVVLP